jgi:hypothetical protein
MGGSKAPICCAYQQDLSCRPVNDDGRHSPRFVWPPEIEKLDGDVLFPNHDHAIIPYRTIWKFKKVDKWFEGQPVRLITR